MIMIAIGCIILLMAIINFFNLSTASGMMRAKEIGLRKVNGVARGGADRSISGGVYFAGLRRYADRYYCG